MAEGAAGGNGAAGDVGVESGRAGSGRWPVSALCCVALLGVFALALLVMNVVGVRLVGDSGYDADVAVQEF